MYVLYNVYLYISSFLRSCKLKLKIFAHFTQLFMHDTPRPLLLAMHMVHILYICLFAFTLYSYMHTENDQPNYFIAPDIPLTNFHIRTPLFFFFVYLMILLNLNLLLFIKHCFVFVSLAFFHFHFHLLFRHFWYNTIFLPYNYHQLYIINGKHQFDIHTLFTTPI